MREQFEKLPEIAERLHTVFYNEDLNQYHAAMINSGLSVKYIQGAWYAFQEQQKQLDLINQYTATQGASIKMLNDERIKQQKNKDAIKQKLHDIYNVCDEDEAVAMLLDEIQELLK